MDCSKDDSSSSLEMLSPTSKSRYGRTRRPKIAQDFYHADEIVLEEKSNKSEPPCLKSPKNRDPLFEIESLKMDDLELKATNNFKNNIPRSLNQKERKFFKSVSGNKTDLPNSMDVTKVFKMISSNSNSFGPTNPVKSALKTYSNKRKPLHHSESFVCESFGLPDEPIVPVQKSVFERENGIDVDMNFETDKTKLARSWVFEDSQPSLLYASEPVNTVNLSCRGGMSFQCDTNFEKSRIPKFEFPYKSPIKNYKIHPTLLQMKKKISKKLSPIEKKPKLDSSIKIENNNSFHSSPSDSSTARSYSKNSLDAKDVCKSQVRVMLNPLAFIHKLEDNKNLMPNPLHTGPKRAKEVTENMLKMKKDVKATKKTRQKKVNDLRKLNIEISQFEIGDLAWAKIGSHPYWPCMIFASPDSGSHKRTVANSTIPRYHVRFFGDRGRRAWVKPPFVLPYHSKDDLSQMAQKFQDTLKSTLLHETYFVKRVKLPSWKRGVMEAEELKVLSVSKRLKYFDNYDVKLKAMIQFEELEIKKELLEEYGNENWDRKRLGDSLDDKKNIKRIKIEECDRMIPVDSIKEEIKDEEINDTSQREKLRSYKIVTSTPVQQNTLRSGISGFGLLTSPEIKTEVIPETLENVKIRKTRSSGFKKEGLAKTISTSSKKLEKIYSKNNGQNMTTGKLDCGSKKTKQHGDNFVSSHQKESRKNGQKGSESIEKLATNNVQVLLDQCNIIPKLEVVSPQKTQNHIVRKSEKIQSKHVRNLGPKALNQNQLYVKVENTSSQKNTSNDQTLSSLSIFEVLEKISPEKAKVNGEAMSSKKSRKTQNGLTSKILKHKRESSAKGDNTSKTLQFETSLSSEKNKNHILIESESTKNKMNNGSTSENLSGNKIVPREINERVQNSMENDMKSPNKIRNSLNKSQSKNDNNLDKIASAKLDTLLLSPKTSKKLEGSLQNKTYSKLVDSKKKSRLSEKTESSDSLNITKTSVLDTTGLEKNTTEFQKIDIRMPESLNTEKIKHEDNYDLNEKKSIDSEKLNPNLLSPKNRRKSDKKIQSSPKKLENVVQTTEHGNNGHLEVNQVCEKMDTNIGGKSKDVLISEKGLATSGFLAPKKTRRSGSQNAENDVPEDDVPLSTFVKRTSESKRSFKKEEFSEESLEARKKLRGSVTKSETPTQSQRESVEKNSEETKSQIKKLPTDELSNSNCDTDSKTSENSSVPTSLDSQVALFRRNNIFKGVTREKVCQVCGKKGEIFRCKGGCNGTFHNKCGRRDEKKGSAKMVVLQADEIKEEPILESKVEIISVESKRTIPDIQPTPNYHELSLAEKIDLRMKEIMQNIDQSANYYESTDSCSEEVSIEPPVEKVRPTKPAKKSLPIIRHVTADHISYMCCDTEEEEVVKVETETKCFWCTNNEPPICFVCNKDEARFRQKCSLQKCGKYYHPKCLNVCQWPQTQWSLIQSTKDKKSDEKYDTFVCPRHVCHTCISDDPRAASSRCPSDKLVKCLKCPATYHTSNHCVPAGTHILTSTQIICPRHYLKKTKKRMVQTINTNWCFICSEGGNLICCETCPTSVHVECLPGALVEDEKFYCEDCQSGRLPLYDEIVWVKLGSFRWWPAVILFPNEVPKNVQNLAHNIGEFVVKFFGTYDHYWVGRGRTFVFQEGDQGHSNGVRNRMDNAFAKAIGEAAVAHKLKKQYKLSILAEKNNGMKPPPYIKIKVNKPVGNVRLFDGNTSNATSCECDPSEPHPCGPDSDCLNRLLLTECNPEVCPAGTRCNNQCFEKREYPPLIPYRTPGRGWGLKTLAPVRKGQFVIEYVGEIIDEQEYQRRIQKMHEQKEENYYFLTIDKDRTLDAGPKGNVARFMNHSCQPNCETQKWTVNGDTRVGLFANCDIQAETELTFNYNLECIGKEKKICRCEAENCSGYIGVKVKQKEPPKKAAKPRKKKPPSQSILETENNPCFICGKTGNVGACNNKVCTKYYHLECVALNSWPEGNKWLCQWHSCNFCTKRTIRCCVKCINSYCPSHSKGNIRHDKMLGFVCLEHDPSKTIIPPEDLKPTKTITAISLGEVTSTTPDDATNQDDELDEMSLSLRLLQCTSSTPVKNSQDEVTKNKRKNRKKTNVKLKTESKRNALNKTYPDKDVYVSRRYSLRRRDPSL